MIKAGAKQQSDLEELIGELAEEYAQRLRDGQKPDIEEYARRHPEVAGAIRQILPALEIMGAVPARERTDNSEPAFSNGQNKALGDFEIVREIGRGGMGVVYEARQLSLSRRVALKVLPFAAVLDERQIQRFRNEALAAAQLDHLHIVDVYGVGCERSVHFYAMRYVEGDTLAEVIAELRRQRQSTGAGPLIVPGSESTGDRLVEAANNTPALAALSTQRTASGREYFRSVARIGVEIASALDHAHQQGVIHRDIKPANVIIDTTGKSWVTDFGLARMESGATLTMTGDLLGTLRYMSPEQALAKRVVVDHRTDVYSLGVTLYELLTLQPAYGDEDRHELLRKIAFEEPKPPRKLNRAVPEELETIVLKAVAKNPNDRYETAQEFADDLQRYLDDKLIRAKRPSAASLLRGWMRRHPTLTIAVGMTSSVTLLALVAVGFILAKNEADARRLAEDRSRTETALRQAAENAVRQEYSMRLRAQSAESDAVAARALADDNLEQVRELFHSLGHSYFLAAVELERLGHDEEAISAYRNSADHYNRFFEQFPSEVTRRDVPRSLAHLLFKVGRDDEANQILAAEIELDQQYIEQYPDNFLCHYSHAQNLITIPQAECHDPRRGVDAALRAVELVQHHGSRNSVRQCWLVLGKGYYHSGDWTAALGALQRSESIAGNDSNPWNNFYQAMTLWQLGDREGAVAKYRFAVAGLRNVPTAELSMVKKMAQDLIEDTVERGGSLGRAWNQTGPAGSAPAA